MFEIDKIRIEHKNGFVYTDNGQPHFSFSLKSDRSGAFLKGARIRVNGWEKEVADQLNIMYEGPGLEPLRAYQVEIEAESDKGELCRSCAVFKTGRMGRKWKGSWISDPSFSAESPESPKPMVFRRRFTAAEPARKVTVLSTAMGIYDLYLDGRRVNKDYFAPGFTDYDSQLQYTIYEITDQNFEKSTICGIGRTALGDGGHVLSKGDHELTAVVAAGWALGRTTHVDNTTKSESKLSADRQALLCDMMLEYSNGSVEIIGSDELFEVTQESPWKFADFYDGEIYDARPSCVSDQGIWRPACKEKLRVHPRLMVRYGEPVVSHEVFTPIEWMEGPGGELICDFGQNIAGVVSFRVQGAEGQEIVFRHAEALEHGQLYVQNLRSARQELRYICREGVQEYSPRFTNMGFRYVGIRGIRREDILELQAMALYSDIGTAGSFHCSDENLNKLQRNLTWSGKDNFVDIPTDCPQRDERQGWTGDIALFAPTACFNFDMHRFLSKWLLDMKSEQGPTGSIPFVIPSRKGITPVITTSCWGDSAILVPYAMYRDSGEIGILRRQYPVMKKYMADVRRWAAMSLPVYRSKYILKFPFQFGDWCAPYGDVKEWLDKGAWVGTAYYANSCSLMGEIAAELGKEEESRRFHARAEKIRDAFRKVFTDQKGHMKEEFQTAYVLALYFRLVPEEERKVMAERLWSLIQEAGVHLSTGFTATPFILFALADHGYTEEAYQLLMQDSSPSWLYQVRRGATTMWESWGAVQEDGTINEASLNHYAYGAVGDFFYRRVCGLEAEEAGYRKFIVKPVPGGGLTEAECTHVCPFGEIHVHWDTEIKGGEQNREFRLQVDVPVGTTCVVMLPNGENTECLSGKYDFRCLI